VKVEGPVKEGGWLLLQLRGRVSRTDELARFSIQTNLHRVILIAATEVHNDRLPDPDIRKLCDAYAAFVHPLERLQMLASLGDQLIVCHNARSAAERKWSVREPAGGNGHWQGIQRPKKPAALPKPKGGRRFACRELFSDMVIFNSLLARII
jgi:hypothetical protein